MTRLYAPSRGVESHILGEEIVLFRADQRRLVRLNTAAAYLWCCCEEGLEASEAVALYADAFGIDLQTARRDTDSILAQWQSSGLIGEDLMCGGGATREPHARLELAVYGPSPATFEPAVVKWYRLLDTTICLQFDDPAVAASAQEPFGHLKAGPAGAATETFYVTTGNGGSTLFTNEGTLAANLAERELIPHIHGVLLVTAYNHAHSLVTVHGAAIGNGTTCIMLPGESGSGKSTLAVALAARGWIYHTDEVSVVSRADGHLRSFPMSAGIKEGSWSALEPFRPEISRLPVYVRTDGKQVRYLPPSARSLPADCSAPYPISHLVFPRYTPGACASLDPIPASEGLCRLTESGYDMAGGLDSERVAALVQWIQDRPCYQLTFSDLAETADLLTELLRNTA